jgi:hypothetical protein
MSSKTPSKASTLARVQSLVEGLQKHFPNGNFTIGNTAYTTATLVQLFESLAAAITAANAAQANARDAVAALRDAKAKVGPTMVALRRILVAMFSTSTPTLADFGIAPPKARAPKTAEQKAAAAAKAKATREARGTKSPKAKRAIKGNVTGITVTPVTTAPAAAEPSQTAPTASTTTPSAATK